MIVFNISPTGNQEPLNARTALPHKMHPAVPRPQNGKLHNRSISKPFALHIPKHLNPKPLNP